MSTQTLRRYLSIQFVLLTVVPLLVVALLVWLIILPSMQTTTSLQHQGMARSIAQQIQAHMLGGERKLRMLAEYFDTVGIGSEQQFSPLLDAACGDGELFEAIYLADQSEFSILRLGLAKSSRTRRDDLLGFDLSGRKFVRNLDNKGDTTTWSETFLSTVSSRQAVALAIPTGNNFLMGEITLDQFSELISHVPVEASYDILVIDSRGRVVADSNRFRTGQMLSRSDLPQDRHQGSETIEFIGESYLGTVVIIPELGWKVLVAQPEISVFKPLRDTLTMIALVLVFAFILASAISLLQAGRLSVYFREWIDRAKEISRGHYSVEWPLATITEFKDLGDNLRLMAQKIGQREQSLIDSENRLDITLNSIGDAVIATDHNGMVTRMNPMAERFTGWSSADAMGQPLTSVFNIINAQTRKSASNPVEAVLEKGEIVGLANDTVLISKGGDEFQIADSGAPIRQEDGEIIGVVLVFRDVTESYVQEKRLIDSEKRLNNLVANVPGLVFEFTANPSSYLDSRFTGIVPDKMREVLGLDSTPESFFEDFYGCLPEEERESFLSNWHQAVNEARPWNFEVRYNRRDGRQIWVSGYSVPQKAGQEVTFYGVLMDVTQRRKTEARLHVTRFAFDTASIGIFWIGEDGRIMDVNQQGSKSLGYSKEELCQLHVFDIDPDFVSEMWPQHMKSIRALGGSKVIETRHQRKNGDSFPVQILINLMDYEGIEYHVAFVQDITERKQSEEELKRAQAYILNIIESMPSILIGVDRKRRITQWNSRAERATGITTELAVNKPIIDILPWLSTETERIDEAINSREVVSENKRSRREDGITLYEDITVYPLIANGVEGAVIRIDDVTEKVRLEEIMVQSEKMLSVGGLAAGMAHEINNPLAGIMQTAHVMSNRLGEKLQMDANRKAAEAVGTNMDAIHHFMQERGILRMLTAINESGKRVADIVDNMLSFARKSDATKSSCHINDLIDKTLELASTDYDLKKQYDFKLVEVVKEYAEDLPLVPSEGAKIQQVLLNLLRNAAQEMQQANVENPRIILRTYLDEKSESVCFEVEDNGPGMEEEIRKRAFEPFFTTKPVGIGTGLGLSVSYFIISENHGGRMTVESRPGEGAKFVACLPVLQESGHADF